MEHGPVLNVSRVQTGDNSHVHNGNIYGGVHNTYNFGGQKDYRERILESLRYDGMDRYRSRRLDSYEGTYKWIFRDDLEVHQRSEDCHDSHHRRDCESATEADKHRKAAASGFQTWLSSSQPTFWISGKPGSDGLDEYVEDHDDLVEMLEGFNRTDKVKMCVSSREWAIFQDAYGGREESMRLRLQDVNQADIDAYVRGRLEESPKFKSLIRTDPEAPMLLWEIRRRAEGVFLWIYLATENLRKGLGKRDTILTLRRRLDTMPAELNDYIEKIFNEIEPCYKRTAARTLLLLNHCVKHDLQLHVAYAAFLEQEDGGIGKAADIHVRQLTDEQICELVMVGRRSLQGWGQDLLNIPWNAATYLAIGERPKLQLVLNSAMNQKSFHPDMIVTYAHQSIFDFLESKSADGSLNDHSELAFDPILAVARYSVRLAKCAKFNAPEVAHLIRELEHIIPRAPVLAEDKEYLLSKLNRTWQSRYNSKVHGIAKDWLGHPLGWPLLSPKEAKAVYFLSLYLCAGSPILVKSMLQRSNDEPLSNNVLCTLLESAVHPVFVFKPTASPRAGGPARFPAFSMLYNELMLRQVNFNVSLLRIDGGLESSWQHIISKLHSDMFRPELDYSHELAWEILRFMMEHGADLEALVMTRTSSSPEEYRTCPAWQAFDGVEEIIPAEASKHSDYCSPHYVSLRTFFRKVRELLHEAYSAKLAGSSPVGSYGTVEAELDQSDERPRKRPRVAERLHC
ncbi:hypothetical protein Slin15195_G086550 [Septoria linicola]|uniref:DUF7791 domain-containing protein n=1 Tax=Septoria linicola TaxID=215465 RepID=A0A9Q9EL07_9PEZI|nr:hypothetical protein Slin14017_G089140 [Septoria linicola]USW55336.1 hypothetical protein Slin15195_G086550 [Septoria linicola]